MPVASVATLFLFWTKCFQQGEGYSISTHYAALETILDWTELKEKYVINTQLKFSKFEISWKIDPKRQTKLEFGVTVHTIGFQKESRPHIHLRLYQHVYFLFISPNVTSIASHRVTERERQTEVDRQTVRQGLRCWGFSAYLKRFQRSKLQENWKYQ